MHCDTTPLRRRNAEESERMMIETVLPPVQSSLEGIAEKHVTVPNA